MPTSSCQHHCNVRVATLARHRFVRANSEPETSVRLCTVVPLSVARCASCWGARAPTIAAVQLLIHVWLPGQVV